MYKVTQKVLVSIGKPSDRRARIIRRWYVDDDNLQDVQAEIAEFIADENYFGQVEADIEENGL